MQSVKAASGLALNLMQSVLSEDVALEGSAGNGTGPAQSAVVFRAK